MKKLMTFVFLCSLVLVSQAQEVFQLPKGYSGGKTVWIVRAGVSFSGVSGKGIDAQEDAWAKSKWSGSFGRAFGGNLSIQQNFWLQSSLLGNGSRCGDARLQGRCFMECWRGFIDFRRL